DRPIVGIIGTGDGRGYWLTSSGGDVFAFGNAAMYGSTTSVRLNYPIVGLAGPRDGGGYWLVARDGGIFSFPNTPPAPPASSSASSAYAWMATNNDASPIRYD